MKNFEFLRLPFLDEAGQWVVASPQSWKVDFDKRSGSVFVKLGTLEKPMNLGRLLAVKITEETEVANVKGTLGRMALTVLGTSLFSEGRNGGLGAGLLDLSIRGAVKKAVVRGTMVFRDSSIMSYSLAGGDFENFRPLCPW